MKEKIDACEIEIERINGLIQGKKEEEIDERLYLKLGEQMCLKKYWKERYDKVLGTLKVPNEKKKYYAPPQSKLVAFDQE